MKLLLGLCLLDEKGNVTKTQNLSDRWSVDITDPSVSTEEILADPNMKKEMVKVMKHQLQLSIENGDEVEKLLFGEKK